MTTKDKLLHISAECARIAQMVEALNKPVDQGGAPEITLSGSHRLANAQTLLQIAAGRFMDEAGRL